MMEDSAIGENPSMSISHWVLIAERRSPGRVSLVTPRWTTTFNGKGKSTKASPEE